MIEKLGIVIQARMGSTRLPAKVLMPLGESNVLANVVERCKKINNGAHKVIVATSTNSIDDSIVDWCINNHVSYYRGSESNVLQRYIDCADKYEISHVLRVTSDCPYLDYEVATDLINVANNDSTYDLWSIKENWSRGLAVELASVQALKRIASITAEEIYLEHVTFYMYEHSREFKKYEYEVEVARQYPQYRLTIDTVEDYEMCTKIQSHFEDGLVSCLAIFDYLIHNPHVGDINKMHVGITPAMDAKR